MVRKLWEEEYKPLPTLSVTDEQSFYPYSYGISDGVWRFPYSILHIPYGPSVFHTYGIRAEKC